MRPRVDPGRLALAMLLAAALAARIGAARLFPNIHWPDEIHQSLEQAHRVVFGYGIVPWEFRIGARSWLLPGLLAGVFRAASALSASAEAYLVAAQAALSVLSLAPFAVAYEWIRRRHGWRIAVAASWVGVVWFELVFFAAKAFSEVVAAHVLVIALWVLGGPTSSRRRVAAAGALLALAVCLRVQLAPAAVVVAVLSCRAAWRERWVPLAAGAVVVLACVGALDTATWRHPFQPIWRSVHVNLVEGRSRTYGVLPPSAYATMLRGVWSWGAIPVLVLAAVGARSRPALACAAVTVLVTHSVVAHKEYRFVYPAIVLVLVAAAVGTGDLLGAVARRGGRRPAWAAVAVLVAGGWTALSLALGVRFSGRDALQLDGSQGSEWLRSRTALEAFAAMRDDPALCGVGLYRVSWAFTGGYSHLHRDVPMFQLWSAGEYARLEPGFNAALVFPDPAFRALRHAGRIVRCWPDGGCLVRRDGPCARMPGQDVNSWLLSHDQ